MEMSNQQKSSIKIKCYLRILLVLVNHHIVGATAKYCAYIIIQMCVGAYNYNFCFLTWQSPLHSD